MTRLAAAGRLGCELATHQDGSPGEVGQMTRKRLSGPAQTRMKDIFAATDLLRRMMSELHSLRAATTSPALAMAIDSQELREQLQELFETVRVLTNDAESRDAEELSHKALDLIKRLAKSSSTSCAKRNVTAAKHRPNSTALAWRTDRGSLTCLGRQPNQR